MMEKRPTPSCMWMPRGRVWLDMLNPDYTDVTIEDIVVPLNYVTRFTAQLPDSSLRPESIWRASVLTHMVLCYDIAEGMRITDEKMLRTIFMHDAQEAMVNDVSGPMKLAMRDITEGAYPRNELSDYDVIEERHELALALRFDLIMPKPQEVHDIDRMALAFEILEHFGEERAAVSESPFKAEDVPNLARLRRDWCADPGVGVRLAKLLVHE